MKEIKAIIQPFMLSKVVNALREFPGLPGVTVSEWGLWQCQGSKCRREGGGTRYRLLKLEIVVPDHLVDDVVQIISAEARTGRPGDGKIFVYPVVQTVRIRSDERGEKAI